MTKKEVIQILGVLSAAYSNMSINEKTVDIWAELLKDIPFEIAKVVAKKHILENIYPPSIADIRHNVFEIMTPKTEQLTAAEAWGEVMSAIRKYGYYREAEALASMSEKTKNVVQFIGWRDICLSEQLDVIRGQFRMMYEQLEERQRKEALLPIDLKNEIQQIVQQHAIKALLEERE
ncbi:replicative helicase loader/inhibitor [Thermoanaerobacterium thermosaccharolyticum]|uniref:replicative helicase loader/inhibitor n=1 Tax=Thermoanaerobacterium thermosaccharolyticum TaxID=1517 RepID=UPI003D273E9E